MLNFDAPKPPKCKHCRRLQMEHQYKTAACPQGRKHRTHGYPFFSATSKWEPNVSRKEPGAEGNRQDETEPSTGQQGSER